jgi:hypothetical protein
LRHLGKPLVREYFRKGCHVAADIESFLGHMDRGTFKYPVAGGMVRMSVRINDTVYAIFFFDFLEILYTATRVN